jgi:hypothetical protein
MYHIHGGGRIMASHSLTIDRFSAHFQIDGAHRMTSARSGALRGRLCIVNSVTED